MKKKDQNHERKIAFLCWQYTRKKLYIFFIVPLYEKVRTDRCWQCPELSLHQNRQLTPSLLEVYIFDKYRKLSAHHRVHAARSAQFFSIPETQILSTRHPNSFSFSHFLVYYHCCVQIPKTGGNLAILSPVVVTHLGVDTTISTIYIALDAHSLPFSLSAQKRYSLVGRSNCLSAPLSNWHSSWKNTYARRNRAFNKNQAREKKNNFAWKEWDCRKTCQHPLKKTINKCQLCG